MIASLLAVLAGLSPCLDQDAPKKEAAKVVVELRHQALVPGHEILLRDVARLRTRDESLARFLDSTIIAPAPKGSWARRLEPKEVREAILNTHSHRGLRPESLTFEGAKTVEVIAATERISPEEIVKTAETVLRSLLADEGETDASWTVAGKPRPLVVPTGRKGRNLTATVPSGRLNRSSALLRVEVKVDDKSVASVPVNFRIQRFREVLVATKAIKRGVPLDADAVAARRVEVASFSQEPLTRPEQVSGWVAARSLRSGSILTAADLGRPAVILKGQSVTVVVRVGRVRVARKGIARADGGVGEFIPVTVGTNKNPVTGKVLAPGLVVNDLTPTRNRIIPTRRQR